MLILPSVVCFVFIFHISFGSQVAFSHIHVFPTLWKRAGHLTRRGHSEPCFVGGVTGFVVCFFFCCLRRLLGRPLRHTCIVWEGGGSVCEDPPGNVLPRRQWFSLFQSNNYQFLDFPCLTVDSVFTGQFPVSSFQFHFNVSLKLWAWSAQIKVEFILVVVTHS